MKYVLAIILLLVLYAWISSARAQAPPAKPAPSPALVTAPAPAPAASFPTNGVSVSEASYPFTPEDKAKIRDFQYESDQLEIQNQKLQLQIEQNKARQGQLLDQEKLVAFNFASRQKISLDQYELDPKEVKFIKKRAGNGK